MHVYVRACVNMTVCYVSDGLTTPLCPGRTRDSEDSAGAEAQHVTWRGASSCLHPEPRHAKPRRTGMGVWDWGRDGEDLG